MSTWKSLISSESRTRSFALNKSDKSSICCTADRTIATLCSSVFSKQSLFVYMNWTGGRLRRQSRNRPDSISKIQKQHFARARIKQQESRQKARIASIEKPSFILSARGSREPSRFVVNSQSSQSVGDIEQVTGSLKPRQSQADLPEVGEYCEVENNNLETNSHIAYVDILKKYLLEKKDWVGLSPTRPLQMKFTPIEEKERIGKWRKLSREDEARNPASTTGFRRISSDVRNPGLDEDLNDGADWDLKIQISSPKRMRRAREYSESPIRSMSSDTMLSGFGEADERYDVPDRDEQRSHLRLNAEDEPFPNSVIRNHDSQSYSGQDLDSRERKSSAVRPDTDVYIRSSSIPVLHRFTLDDQILAERSGNSPMNAGSSRCHQSDRHSLMPSHGVSKHHHTIDHKKLLSSSPKINSDDRHTDLNGSHKSHPTDSDTLPQTQKISRQLPPSQSLVAKNSFSEAHFRTPRVTSRLSTRPESVVSSKRPMMLFGQEVAKPFDNDTVSYTKERPFPSNIHSYYTASRHAPPVETPRTVIETSASKSVTGTPRPSPGFRLPSLWTPHRNIPQLSPHNGTDLKFDLPTSPIAISHRRPSPFISTLSQGNHRARQPLNTAKSALINISGDLNVIDGHDEFVNAPVFNIPFRR